MQSIIDKKDDYVKYYKQKFKDHFSPAILDYHVEKAFNNAIKTYNPNKASFQTHLSNYMNKLNRVANSKGGLVKKTEYSSLYKNKVINTMNEIETLTGQKPTEEELAKKLGMPVSKVKEIIESEQHVAIVHGVDTSKIEITPETLLSGLSKDEEKVLHTITKNMSPDKAYKYTGLGKTKYYEQRKKIEKKLKSSYINHLRNYSGHSGS